MEIPGLSLMSNMLKSQPRMHGKANTHLLLAGLYQSVFRNHWGEPEITFSLDWLQGIFEGDSLFLRNEPSEEDCHTVWIYKKRDKILFFKRGRLTSHFKWSAFRARWKRSGNEVPSRRTGKLLPLVTTPFSLVA